MSDPLRDAPPSLLVKLGSIMVHAEEALSTDGHAFDVSTLQALMDDPEVVAWREAMARLALLPVKREASNVDSTQEEDDNG